MVQSQVVAPAPCTEAVPADVVSPQLLATLEVRLRVAEAKQLNSLLGVEDSLHFVPLRDGSAPRCEYPECIAALAMSDARFPHKLPTSVKVSVQRAHRILTTYMACDCTARDSRGTSARETVYRGLAWKAQEAACTTARIPQATAGTRALAIQAQTACFGASM